MSTEEASEEQEEEGPALDDAEYLREQYHEQNKTQAEIAEQHGVTASTVSHYMSKHDIETRGTQVIDERLEDPEWLEEKYVNEDLTMQEIADEVGCSDGTVMRRLRHHGVVEPPEEEEEEAKEEEEEDEEQGEDVEETEE